MQQLKRLIKKLPPNMFAYVDLEWRDISRTRLITADSLKQQFNLQSLWRRDWRLLLYSFFRLSTAWARKTRSCSFMIFKNTTDLWDATLFDHVETYFHSQGLTQIVGKFLGKGNVRAKFRFVIKYHHKILEIYPASMMLEMYSNPEETDFFTSDLYDLDKQAFLNVLSDAFRKSYFNRTLNHRSSANLQQHVKWRDYNRVLQVPFSGVTTAIARGAGHSVRLYYID